MRIPKYFLLDIIEQFKVFVNYNQIEVKDRVFREAIESNGDLLAFNVINFIFPYLPNNHDIRNKLSQLDATAEDIDKLLLVVSRNVPRLKAMIKDSGYG